MLIFIIIFVDSLEGESSKSKTTTPKSQFSAEFLNSTISY
jgi:hypothetical protein